VVLSTSMVHDTGWIIDSGVTDQLFSLLIFHYIIVYLSLHFQIIYCLLVKLQKNWTVWY
jgi:hypothetical protein